MGLKENIRKRRLELHLTLEEVSKQLNVSKPTLQRYESGVISNIPADKIEKLADLLETTPAYLMGWNTDQNETNKISLTNDELDLLKKYNSLDDMGKHTVRSILTLEYNRCK